MSPAPKPANRLLPMSRAEMDAWGWDALDVLLVTGDAHVDHPSFGAALLGRWLVHHGFRVGIVAQPRWDTTEDIERLGRPRLFAGVTAGALDSMLSHYTAFRKKRHDDAYTPGGKAGARPNRACIVYTNLVKRAFPGLPVVLGGIEASLRRFSHYDFWSDQLRRSILLDAKADAIVYGMGERAALDIARQLAAADASFHPASIPGLVFAAADESAIPSGAPVLRHPTHEEILAEPRLLIESTQLMEGQVQDERSWAVQRVGDRVVILTPPAPPLSTELLDSLYSLSFTRLPHPSHEGAIPAVDMIRFSVTSHRGCAGGCSFCTLSAHQGRSLASRSAASIRKEVETMTRHPDWKGQVSDVGGPSANMWGGRCVADPTECRRASCLHPRICRNFKVDQGAIARLLNALAGIHGVKGVRVASGIRHDLAALDRSYVKTLIRDYVGGQLKLAPEHICDDVLGLMRKPSFQAFEQFLSVVEHESETAGKQQYVIPYLMSAFPGCTDSNMQTLATWLRRRGWKPQQVQCFIPIPGTVAGAMYYAGVDASGRAIHVARTDAERLRQHRILVGEEEEILRRESAREKTAPGRSTIRNARGAGRPAAAGKSRPPRPTRNPRGRKKGK